MTSDVRVRRATTDTEIERCHPVMVQLRPHVQRSEFSEVVRRLAARGGYALVYVEDGGRVAAVAGYRVLEMLSRGRFLYVDDLVTAADARSRGHGALLLDWLVAEARRLCCTRVDLDSGTGRERAHAFYRRRGMDVTALHFAVDVPPG